ncbi:hypothetical protein Scep_029325 [Stephania cephalantha]|uniref:DYW domain-containing protein n=1 Tax=Stephania cephalantha TaxID=152367 RepID=A0AAP0E537_9MAGN
MGKHLIFTIVSLSAPMSYAHNIFSQIQHPINIFTWNTMIRGYAESDNPAPAIELHHQMIMSVVEPDNHTYPFLLKACAKLMAVAVGEKIHCVAVRSGAHVYMFKVGLDENVHAGNALIDMYAKCGSIWEAYRVFDEMESRSVVSWTSLIVGLAVNGFGKEALDLFCELERKGLVPSEITFVGVLYACSHCGMVDKGFGYFRRMTEEYGIVPKIEHYGCLVDLLGRAGLVREAHEFVLNMPLKPNAVVWRTLLGACMIHGHLTLGETIRSKLLQIEPKHSGDYVLLSNLYASERRWSDVQKVRKKMLREGVKKTPGHSLVELRNCVHEFVMGDKSHPQSKEIYEMLDEVMNRLKLEGYVPSTTNVLADIEEEEKEKALSYHSEKIAIAFALINTPPKTPIRVVKNLRVCSDCHLAIKLMAKVLDREIIVRDRSRFHHFKDGHCSCGDFW